MIGTQSSTLTARPQSSLEAQRKRDLDRFGDPRLASPFGDFDEIYPATAWRTIPLTDELRASITAADAERERRHRASITWTPPYDYTPAAPKAVPNYMLPIDRGQA